LKLCCCCCCTLSYLECLCDSLCIKQLYITNFPRILLFMFEFVFYLCTIFLLSRFYSIGFSLLRFLMRRIDSYTWVLVPPSFFFFVYSYFIFI
jgi:hypothetical protein